jgi:hypothetical protein
MKEQFQKNLKKYRKQLEADPNPDLLKISQILAGEIDWKTIPEKELDRLFPANVQYKKDRADPDVVFFKEKGKDFRKRLEGWIPPYMRSKLREAVNNGMPWREFKLVYGNALGCKVTIDTERMMNEWHDDPITQEKLEKKFPIETWFMYPRIKPVDIIQEQRKLKGIWLDTENKEIPIENLIDDSEWIEEKVSLEELENLDFEARKELLKQKKFRVTSRTAMSKILRYFFDQGGNYSGIYRTWILHTNNRTKAKWYVETIVILGTIAKGSHSDKILLDKYEQKKIPKKGKP